MLNEHLMANSNVLNDYLISFTSLIPFLVSSLIVMRRMGVWYLDALDTEGQRYAYIAIHALFVSYSFGLMQTILGKILIRDTVKYHFIWIELMHIFSVTLVVGVIMWVVLNGIRISFRESTGKALFFGDYIGYMGISLMLGFMYAAFIIPDTINSLIPMIQSGSNEVHKSLMFAVIETGVPISAVIVGGTWLWMDYGSNTKA